MRVAVVGAGIIGITSAVAVQQAFPDLEICVFANEFSPDTTGDGSAGLWGPYLIGSTPPEQILRWAESTHRWLENLWKSEVASEAGVSLLPVYRLTSDPKGFEDVVWTKAVYGARKLGSKELAKLSEEHKANYRDGWFFVTYTSEPVKLLPWLTRKFVAAGGKLCKRKIHRLQELHEDGYDLIINCSGLGARELVTDNETITPIRGQVSRVKADWAKHAYIVDDNDGNYIIPNIDSVVLGGTHQENDYDCTPRKEDTEFIHRGCSRMLPGMKGAELLKEWVGLRPGRSCVRFEPEILRSPRGQMITVIHNYGHGGSGVTLSWGCAVDVVKYVRDLRDLKSNL